MRTLLALALLVPAASAGVIVVDPAAGPGSDFTLLSEAIDAAVTGDVILLRTGTYDGGFKIGGQAISLVADAGATVHITNSSLGAPGAAALAVGSQVAGVMVLRGLLLSTPVSGGVPLLASGVAVPDSLLIVEDCDVTEAAAVGMELNNGSPMVLIRSDADGSNPILNPVPGQPPFAEGNPALSVFAGPLAVFGGFYAGGDGLPAGIYGKIPTDGHDGSPGLQFKNIDNSLKVLSGGIAVGGVGGDGAAPFGFCLPPGDGGDGVQVVQGGNVHVAGFFGTGDLPGIGAAGCNQTGEIGELLAAVPPGEVPTWLPGNPVQLSATRVAREGEVVTLAVSGALDQDVRIVVGVAPRFGYMPALSGVLVVKPSFVIDPGPVGFLGETSFEAHVPELGPGVQSLFVYVQALSKNEAGLSTLGMPSVVLLLDEHF